MRHLILSAFLIACFTSLATAQTQAEFNKFEVFAGYSSLFVERGVADASRVNERYGLDGIEWMKPEETRKQGVNIAATNNLKRYLGLKLDFSAYRYRIKYGGDMALPEEVTRPSLAIKDLGTSLYNFMGGVQLKNNGQQKIIKPFAHVLFGSVLARDEKQINVSDQFSGEHLYSERLTISSSGFAGAAGGGLDVKYNDRLDLRLVQVDFYRSNIGSSRMSGVRIGIGVVFR